MLEYDFEQSVGYWLFMANQAFQKTFAEELLPEGITYRQMQVLGWLAIDGDQSQADLARKMEIEPATLVGIIDRMEKANWISRESCPHDRRKNFVRVRPGAEEAWEKIKNGAYRVRAQATAGMSEDDRRQLLSLLAQVHSNLTGAAVVPRK